MNTKRTRKNFYLQSVTNFVVVLKPKRSLKAVFDHYIITMNIHMYNYSCFVKIEKHDKEFNAVRCGIYSIILSICIK